MYYSKPSNELKHISIIKYSFENRTDHSTCNHSKNFNSIMFIPEIFIVFFFFFTDWQTFGRVKDGNKS